MAGEALVRAPNQQPPKGAGVVVDQAALVLQHKGAKQGTTRPSPFGASLRGIGVRQHCLTKKQKKGCFAAQKKKPKNGVLRTPKKVKKNRTFFPSLARSASAFVDPQKLYIIPQDIF